MKTFDVLGVAGSWEIIFDLKANRETKFMWGLEEANNNQIEALAVWQSIKVFKF
jgi:hypothetical protein